MLKQTFVSGDGVKSEVIWNNDSAEVRTSQRVDGIIDEFRRDSENINHKAAGRLAARIPTELFYRWRKEWRDQHSDKWEWRTWLAMRLNSPDYSHLRNQKI